MRYKFSKISEESAAFFVKVEDTFLSQKTTGVRNSIRCSSINNSGGHLVSKVTTVRRYCNGAGVVVGRRPPASCCRMKEQQVNPEGALAFRTGSENYLWDPMF